MGQKTPTNPFTGTIIGFHTTDQTYTREAERLRRCLDLLALPYEIRPVESLGGWVRNAAQKPTIIQEMRARYSGSLLYVDVDAVFHQNPWNSLGEYQNVDIAFYRTPEGELLSGTLLLNDTPGAAEILERWVAACASSPEEWDQVILDKVLQKNPEEFRIATIPASFCWIFDCKNQSTVDIVIEHLQASREGRERKFGFIVPNRLRRRRNRIEEIERILFSEANRAESTPDRPR